MIETDRDAFVAKIEFEAFMSRLGKRFGFAAVDVAVSEYENLLLREEAEEALECLEPSLRAIADSLGFQYVEPELTDEGVRLLASSAARFFKRYVFELKRVQKNCAGGIVYI